MSMVCGFFLWSMASFDGGVFALCGKTVGALRRNLLLPLHQWLGPGFSVKEHRGDNRLTVQVGNRKNTYYLFGGQDESACTLIQGITLCGVLLDEVVLMPRSFVEQACARCSVAGSKLWFSCNPASAEHWFYKEWIEKQVQKNVLRLHFTMDDNPGLNDRIKARYQRLYTGTFYKRFVLGQWCESQGLVYQIDKNRHFFQEPPKAGRYYISVDYGTRNPFSAGLWCVTGGVAYRLREYYYQSSQTGITRTDEEHHDALVSLAAGLPVEQVIVDPSAASFIAVLRKKGIFRVRKANNAVLPGIALVASLLQQGKLRFSESCENTRREFSLYCWEDDPGRDVPRKEQDHAMDDIRYFCMHVMRRAGEADFSAPDGRSK